MPLLKQLLKHYAKAQRNTTQGRQEEKVALRLCSFFSSRETFARWN